MIKYLKFKFVIIYYMLIIAISTFIMLFCGKKYDSYGQVFLMFTSTPLFFILSKISFNKYSDEIELNYPNLFEKYKMTYGVVKRINGADILNNPEFEKLDDQNLKNQFKLIKQLTWLTILSFVALILFGVLFMLIKR